MYNVVSIKLGCVKKKVYKYAAYKILKMYKGANVCRNVEEIMMYKYAVDKMCEFINMPTYGLPQYTALEQRKTSHDNSINV